MTDPAAESHRPRADGVSILVNAKAGTARTLDKEATLARLREVAEHHGKPVTVAFVEPEELIALLTKEAARPEVGIIIVGGGDGTISSAGNLLAGGDVALGVIPLGTFNLFARTIGIPLEFEEALTALETATVERVDVGDINGEVFLHAVSLGVHEQVIRQRDRMAYGSKIGKMFAGVRAWVGAVRRLSSVSLAFDGDYVAPRRRYRQVAVTLGPLTEGVSLPLAETLTDGALGLLLLPERSRMQFVRAAIAAAFGRWKTNPYIDHHRVKALRIRGSRPRFWVSVDGEVTRMAGPVSVSVRPGALLVLRPRPGPEPETASETGEA
jgi:diacylglycerol kinase family enzyme